MAKTTVIADCEVYRDYFLVGLRNAETGNTRLFDSYPGSPLDTKSIGEILARDRIVTFNGNNYDLPILGAALKGKDCEKLKEISDKIIIGGLKHWQIGTDPVNCDHIDLFELAPGRGSLKVYGGRLHCPTMQDLPFDPSASITPEMREQLRVYNTNDLELTNLLFNRLLPQIEMRERMSKVYDIDLRSKSDAQIAEAVISKEVGVKLGEAVQRPTIEEGTKFSYQPPPFIKFQAQNLIELLSIIKLVEFTVPKGGSVELPFELKKAAVRVGHGLYRLGIGGLHSSEQTISHFTNDKHVIVDRDVVSYYPRIILNTGLEPEHMKGAFWECYSGLVDQRVKAKREGDLVVSDILKIVINGSFGKLGSKWSKLYAPSLLIQTTITGQLSLLMLIERLEEAGVEVVSANTDGVAIKCERSKIGLMESVISDWEIDTGFETEENPYRALHSRDVNNYIAIKLGGGLKLKGAYAPPGLMKNPTNTICVIAAIAFLSDYTPVEKTIRECIDIRKFVTIRQVNGGAVDQDGNYLGKVVRWYYANGVDGPLTYKLNGYTVARSDGARALMTLPSTLPSDINYDWYVAETKSMLADFGLDSSAYQIRDLV